MKGVMPLCVSNRNCPVVGAPQRRCRVKYKYSVEEMERMEKNPWLTDRERKVFHYRYKRGWNIEDVAAQLYVHRNTVNNDLRSIREKCI